MVNLAVTQGPCDSVGLQTGRDDGEYGIWMHFRARGLNPRIEHVGVQNASARYYLALPPFSPDVILTIRLYEKEFDVKHISKTP